METTTLEPIEKLSKDLREAAQKMGVREIRYLVDGYYSIQEQRKAVNNQLRAAKDGGEPGSLLEYLAKQMERLEYQIKGGLDRWTTGRPEGLWMRAQTGIGPVITAGTLAHIDIKRAPTVGHIWSFAGLENAKWFSRKEADSIVKELLGSKKKVNEEILIQAAMRVGKKPANVRREAEKKTGKLSSATLAGALAKRPWNADFKTLLWKTGDSFCKFHNHKDCFYGKLYAERKAIEVRKNEAGDFAHVAKTTLAERNIKDKDTLEVYESGKLPAGRIEQRARRWAVKIFLSHLHTVLYFQEYGKTPPVPFSFTKGGGSHAHYIMPPHLEEHYPKLLKALRQEYGG